MRELLRIVTTGRLEPGRVPNSIDSLSILDIHGNEVRGVTGIDIKIRPNELIEATFTAYVDLDLELTLDREGAKL